MADIKIDDDSQFLRNLGDGRRVFTTSRPLLADIRTYFFLRGHASGIGDVWDFIFYRADGLNPGSWSSSLLFSPNPNGSDIVAMAGWLDSWTPNRFGDEIHCCFVHIDTINAPGRDFGYGVFNTVSETFVTSVIDTTVEAPTNIKCGITVLNGGLKFAFWFSAQNEEFRLYLSGGAAWFQVVSLSGPTATVCGCPLGEIAQIEMVPSTDQYEATSPFFVIKRFTANNVGDGLYCGVYSGAEMISTQPLTGHGFLEEMSDEDEVLSSLHNSFSLAVNEFTGAYYIAYFNHEPDHVDHELRIVRMDTSTDPPVQLADIGVSGDNWCPQLTIDQVTGTMYIGLLGGIPGGWPLQVRTLRTQSNNGGFSWEGPFFSSAAQGEYWGVWGPHSFAFGGDASALFWVYFVREDTNSVLQSDWYSVNSDNLVAGLFTVDNVTPGNEVANCPIGQALGASSIPGDFNPHGYPQYMSSVGTVYLSIIPGKTGSLAIGDKIRGKSSRATGTFQGWSGNASERIKITSARPGPYGKPFLPGETIEKYDDPSITVTVAASPSGTSTTAVVTDQAT